MLYQLSKWNESGRLFHIWLFTKYKFFMFKLLSLSVLCYCLDLITSENMTSWPLCSLQSYVWHFLRGLTQQTILSKILIVYNLLCWQNIHTGFASVWKDYLIKFSISLLSNISLLSGKLEIIRIWEVVAQGVFYEKGFLRNFANFTEKFFLVESLF